MDAVFVTVSVFLVFLVVVVVVCQVELVMLNEEVEQGVLLYSIVVAVAAMVALLLGKVPHDVP